MKQTALITGASSGIGLELARLFAHDGWDVVLVARSDAKLRALADSLSEDRGVTARVPAPDARRLRHAPRSAPTSLLHPATPPPLARHPPLRLACLPRRPPRLLPRLEQPAPRTTRTHPPPPRRHLHREEAAVEPL